MGQIAGEVSLRELSNSRGIRSFVEKRIQGWLYREGIRDAQSSASGLPSFHVMFERQGEGHLVSCWIEVRIGRQIWRSARVVPGIQQAFIQALQHLIPIHPPVRALSLA